MSQSEEKPLLPTLKGPADVKALAKNQLEQLAQEIRDLIIEVTAANGGHIGPNLGVVELTIMLHRVFNSPEDPFVFDVAHQGYVHKLLTGRQGAAFEKLRQTGGLSGFLNRAESEYDSYGAGHAGTALSAALGMATARDLNGTDENVVAVIGDATLTCGIALEALNNIVQSTKKMVVILNDNEWSIAKNVGAISKYLGELITNPTYNRLHHDLEGFLKKIPGGDSLIQLGGKMKKEAKDFFVPSSLFEKLGLRYLGPIDGHDFDLLKKYLEFARTSPESVLLHVITQKGRGYDIAINQPERFHGASPFDPETGKSLPSKPNSPPNYQNVFGEHLSKLARKDKDIIGITAAMPSGTGLNIFQKELPGQFFDVGIAEEHAVLFAAGLATKGKKPVVAIYSTFLQRAYDPIIHDVCLQNLPVVFCMDRAGLSPNDGPTHHGLFDLSYLRCVPNAVIMQPKDEDEQVDMLYSAIKYERPTFIRWPRGAAIGTPIKSQPAMVEMGKAEIIREGADIQLWALGPWVEDCKRLAPVIAETFNVSVGVVNARFAKPLDQSLLEIQSKRAQMIVTFEDNVIQGGFGSGVLEAINELNIKTSVLRIGWPDNFVEHGSSVNQLRLENGLDDASILGKIEDRIRKLLGITRTNTISSAGRD
ncbi:MAG: 1-deoxy-D-xylulose-5-phosphate synthase [Verrucomicrobia bacterium]|nr:1-deoxy-D-xylulose-5-phosphate synthase [Verrucomicrobiota bacterium]MDA1066744.1 1-deoxy-D-xylulose-5-phosphate synthase [Verrucomicrobiota bacterium]